MKNRRLSPLCGCLDTRVSFKVQPPKLTPLSMDPSSRLNHLIHVVHLLLE